MEEEVGECVKKFELNHKEEFGDLKIYRGKLNKILDKEVYLSLAWSGWGKVSSARAVTRLISVTNKTYQKVDFVLFTGVAGGIENGLNQWDIVISSAVIQHDMDARPLFKKFEVPALKKSKLFANNEFVIAAEQTLRKSIKSKFLKVFGDVRVGLIGTGDSFVSDINQVQRLKNEINDLCAVEMEGAAVAQVAEQEKIPWLVIRVISDNSDDTAADNFTEFLAKYKNYSCYLLEDILKGLAPIIRK